MSRRIKHKQVRQNLNLGDVLNKSEVPKIKFCFKYAFTFFSTKIDKFTNYYKDEEDFLNFFSKVFQESLPDLSDKTYDELKSGNYHLHKIRDKENNLVHKILKSILKKSNELFNDEQIEKIIDQNFGDTDFYQLSLRGGIRLIGVFTNSEIFEVLFFDQHHLIYPDQHHNEQNFMSYSFSPYERKN